MPHVTFVYPCVGRFPRTRYVRSWQMQPLSIGVLSALTPPAWSRTFFDDRLETVRTDLPTDLAAISVETYTARRAYQIAAEFKRRGVPVLMGGFHASARPEEALEHADAVCVGDAEGIWPTLLDDASARRLRGIYRAPSRGPLAGVTPDRGIFRGKRYFPLALVESSRGCPFDCRFCSVTAFHNATCRRRPAAEIAAEIRGLREKTIFFVDDNIVGDAAGARELFHALIPLNIRWISQASLDIALDPELLDLAAASGCRGLLIGFESLDRDRLAAVGKRVNLAVDYAQAIRNLRSRGIFIYGTFMFGLDGDTPDTLRRAVSFAREQRLFLAAFAHLVPFPGTPLYDDLERGGRLRYERWWLSGSFRFGEAPFHPSSMSSADLVAGCHAARKAFYSLPSIAARSRGLAPRGWSAAAARTFWALNLMLRGEVDAKRGLPLGLQGDGQAPMDV